MDEGIRSLSLVVFHEHKKYHLTSKKIPQRRKITRSLVVALMATFWSLALVTSSDPTLSTIGNLLLNILLLDQNKPSRLKNKTKNLTLSL